MEGIFYFFFGWLIGSGSGEEVVESVTSLPEASGEMVADVSSMILSTPWLLVPVIIAIIFMGIGVFSRFITDCKDNGRG